MLDNVGRESETYLNYIINNYYNLPDIIVFSQAKITDHRSDADFNYLLKLMNEAKTNKISNPSLIHLMMENNKNIHWDKDWNFRDGNYYLENNYYQNEKILFSNFMTLLIIKIYASLFNIFII